MELLRLGSDQLEVIVDPGRGADVLSILARQHQTELLFSTPWRERADAIRRGDMMPNTVESGARWHEQYRGGWQTLCPNAGPPRTAPSGAPYGFHGEAATIPWNVDHVSESAAALNVELFTAPLRIIRELRLVDGRFTQQDRVINLSRHDVQVDYSSHPAFGREFLGEGATITADAKTFVADHDGAKPGIVPGSAHAWPWLHTQSGRRDMRVLPPSPHSQSLFGSLTEFEHGRVTITNASGLALDLEWDAQLLPYAWVWQELESTDRFPWFGRARVLAIEPASTPTSGPGRTQSLDIPAFGDVHIGISLSVKDSAAASRG